MKNSLIILCLFLGSCKAFQKKDSQHFSHQKEQIHLIRNTLDSLYLNQQIQIKEDSLKLHIYLWSLGSFQLNRDSGLLGEGPLFMEIKGKHHALQVSHKEEMAVTSTEQLNKQSHTETFIDESHTEPRSRSGIWGWVVVGVLVCGGLGILFYRWRRSWG